MLTGLRSTMFAFAPWQSVRRLVGYVPRVQDFRASEGFIRTYDLIEALSDDVHKAFKLLEDDKQNQYLWRSVVRAVFSFVEALIESVKVEIRMSLKLEKSGYELNKKEKELLGSLSPIFIDKGRQISLKQNLKMTFKLAAKVWEIDFRPDSDGGDYRDFVIAKTNRNKLTHPKTYYDVEITDDDMHFYAEAVMWVQEELTRLFKAKIDSLDIYVKTMKLVE